MLVEQELNLKDALKEYFGYNQFRGTQERIIRNILDKKNTFVIMPTGAGKSLCLSVASPGTGRYRYCDLSPHRPDEKSGRSE